MFCGQFLFKLQRNMSQITLGLVYLFTLYKTWLNHWILNPVCFSTGRYRNEPRGKNVLARKTSKRGGSGWPTGSSLTTNTEVRHVTPRPPEYIFLCCRITCQIQGRGIRMGTTANCSHVVLSCPSLMWIPKTLDTEIVFCIYALC